VRTRFFEPGERRVKICGLSRESDARQVIELGADALGFNFWSQSKRYLEPAGAIPWIQQLPGDATRVAVVVNPDIELLAFLRVAGCFDAIQFHGDETPEFCERQGAPRWIKAYPVRPENQELPDIYATGDFLLDSPSVGYGGSGEAADWTLAADFVRARPSSRFTLAGGLTPANVFEAVAAVQPHGVDVASGVEVSPGVKDLSKVREFIVQAKG